MTRRLLPLSILLLATGLLCSTAAATEYSFDRDKYLGKGKVDSEKFSGSKYKRGLYFKKAHIGTYGRTEGRFEKSGALLTAAHEFSAGAVIFDTYTEFVGSSLHLTTASITNYANFRLFGQTIKRWGIGNHDFEVVKKRPRKKLGTVPIAGVPVTFYLHSGVRFYGEITLTAGTSGIRMSGHVGVAPWISLMAMASRGITAGLQLVAEIGATEAHLNTEILTNKKIMAVGWFSIQPLRLVLKVLLVLEYPKCKKKKRGVPCGWRKRIGMASKTLKSWTVASVRIGSLPVLYFIRKDPEGKFKNQRGKTAW